MKSCRSPITERRKTGRPLSFDRDKALEKAMLAFWEHGYETTSIAELTEAMGITAPSLYTAFGDKKRLFLEAMHLYAGDPAARAQSVAAAPSAYDAARDMLHSAAQAFTDAGTPPGCLLASATATGSKASVDVQRAVAEIRGEIRSMLRARIERDKEIGKMPSTANASALADLVVAVIQGMSVLARDGAACPVVRRVADAALEAWPRA
ncbi:MULTISPECIES: TetR/AcrR family transcriptional regulator [Sphingomonas]|uniref:TetR/AcrR family transcriptional regulator n=1 Tax=Sphingomonas TaxID=13687 RepID=UPI000DEEF51E|nr:MULTISPECIES: TetR/AcrR family transcriptional regulator [Sphingomonas]